MDRNQERTALAQFIDSVRLVRSADLAILKDNPEDFPDFVHELVDMACNRITAAITAAFAAERSVKVVVGLGQLGERPVAERAENCSRPAPSRVTCFFLASSRR